MTIRDANRCRTIAIILTAASMGLLTGCTSDGPLPAAERPEVVWEDGQPTGPLEGNPWVQAVRASDLELRIAHATRDFTDPALGETTTLSGSGGFLTNVERAARNQEWTFPPGPTPMIPIHVEESTDGQSATVYTCSAAWWQIDADSPEVEKPLRGLIMKHDLVLEDGHHKVNQRGGSNPEGAAYVLGEDVIAPFLDDREDSDCNLDDAKIGLFDPQPDVTVEYTPEDIKTEADE